MKTAPLTDAEIAELREQHTRMLPAFRRIPFERVLSDPVLLGCLRNTLHARRDREAVLKATAARSAANFELTP